jgi:hypothetical protein
MAYVKPMKNKDGVITSHRAIWRLGGSRTGAPQAERFDPTEEGRRSAEVFRQAVDDNGQQWPPGCVKGEGYIDPSAGVEESFKAMRSRPAGTAAGSGTA